MHARTASLHLGLRKASLKGCLPVDLGTIWKLPILLPAIAAVIAVVRLELRFQTQPHRGGWAVGWLNCVPLNRLARLRTALPVLLPKSG